MQDSEILAQLKEKTAGEYFMSESDYPFETVNWGNGEITEEFLLNVPSEQPGGPVEEQSFEMFYQKYGSRHAALEVLKNNLTDLKVYRVGRINIGVHIVGRSPEGNWLGLSTRSVET
jgi:hypothetical protein